MSDDGTRFEGSKDARSGDSFAPETVDEAAAARLADDNTTEHDDEGRLVAALPGVYALPPEAESSLERVRARLRQKAAQDGDRHGWRRERDERKATNDAARVAPVGATRQSVRRTSRVSAALRAVAAVLVVALLGGGFFALLHRRPGTGSGAGVWSNVSVTHARLASPLEFAPARGVTYAVAATGGTIYACDANHLWYSTDNGHTYAPFPLAYPASDTSQPDDLCNMDTAPGAPGIFVVVHGKQTRVEYAAAGDGGWRTLGMPDTVSDVATGKSAVPLAASEIAQAVSSDPDHAWLKIVGNWVFVLARAPGDGYTAWRLVATPDFGTTWYQLDGALQAQNLQCAGFAVAASDPMHLFCGTVDTAGTGVGAGIWESVNGGLSWRQMSLPFSRRALGEMTGGAYLYVLENGPGITETLWRHAITGGVWEQVAALPQPEFNAGSLQPPPSFSLQGLGVGLDDTAYAWIASDDGKTVTVRVFALLPGSSGFTEVGERSSMAFSGKSLTLELGDTGPGGSPALYLHDHRTSANDRSQPLYRLGLPTSDTPVRPVTTPLPQPPPTATATPVPPAACTTATGSLADIQPGGFGATVDTFDTRWGQHHGAAAGSLYFGPNAASGNWVVSAAEPASNDRIYMMSYRVDPSKTLTLAQAEALAATILPRDATRMAGPHTTQNGTEVDYCSAALIAAFPPDVQMSVAPLFHDGRIAVIYDVDSAGDVRLINFTQHVF